MSGLGTLAEWPLSLCAYLPFPVTDTLSHLKSVPPWASYDEVFEHYTPQALSKPLCGVLIPSHSVGVVTETWSDSGQEPRGHCCLHTVRFFVQLWSSSTD
jgi:hypothetical protein